MTIFNEGAHVDYVGDGRDGIPAAAGRIMALASSSAVHVRWDDGPRRGKIDLVSVWDLEKSASEVALIAPTQITSHSVRRVMNTDGEAGVLNFLSAAKRIDTWTGIAKEALDYVERALRADASMDLAYEQLRADEVDSVVSLAARTLLAQAFGEAS